MHSHSFDKTRGNKKNDTVKTESINYQYFIWMYQIILLQTNTRILNKWVAGFKLEWTDRLRVFAYMVCTTWTNTA